MNPNYYQTSNFSDGLKIFFRQGSPLAILILINSGIWIIVQILRVLLFLFNEPDSSIAISQLFSFLALPAYLPKLVTSPWTLITYMFFHIDIWHILFNMLWLYWFGKIFIEYMNGRKLVTVYLLGGISGGLLYILAFNIFPAFSVQLPNSYALGASASVMAVVAAISFYVPNYSLNLLFIGRIKVIYLAIVLFIFDFFMIPAGNSGGHLAHIGGALFGFLYVQFLPVGKMNILGDLFRRKKKPLAGFGNFDSRPVTDETYNYQKAEKQKRIDEILEKISKGGYDSLSKEEKEFLFKSSGKK
ncbi:MAG: rhomboid family intramembrane serine protease [bacterium]